MIENMYDEKNDIIIVKIGKDTNAVEILENMRFWNKSYEPTKSKLKILIDNSEFNVRISFDEMAELNKEIEALTIGINEIRQAMLVSNPLITALATLFGGKSNNPKLKTKVFSTKEAAVNWLNI